MAARPPAAVPPAVQRPADDTPRRGAAPAGAAAVVAVAFSGGFDSLALLHATCRAAAGTGVQVVALHVHHGLLPEADAWLDRARRLCARWRQRGWPLTLRWARLDGRPAPGDSLEAWARAGRYAALARLAGEAGASLVLLAQHRRDQAETVLLQALRGGGPEGLSAMPAAARRAGLQWARPWLDQPRSAIEAYLRRHRLRAVEDPSNADPRLARARLRQQLWPALLAAFPDAETALARAAQRAQQARAALDELAALDLAPLVDDAGRLAVAGWRSLSPARQANALRAWWRAQTGRGAPDTLVQRLLAEVPARGAAAWPAGAGWSCRFYRGRLQAGPGELAAAGTAATVPVQRARRAAGAGTAATAATAAGAPGAALPPSSPALLDLSRPGLHPVPGWSGWLEVRAVARGGLDAAALRAVQARARSGGERFQGHAAGLPRSLKKQYQQAGIPAQARAGPLLWAADGRLLFVPGLGVDARWPAAPDGAGLALHWRPQPASPGPLAPPG